VPWGAIKARQEEQERRERREQLNNLFNELIKQGETVDITVGNMELRIKQRKMVDENKNQEISLPEAIALIVVAGFLAFLPIFIERFFS
jgi:hypothetical protein